MHSLVADHVHSLVADHVHSLVADHVHSLVADHVHSLVADHVHSLVADHVHSLVADHVHSLATDHVRSLAIAMIDSGVLLTRDFDNSMMVWLQTSGTTKWDYKINTVALDGYHGQTATGRFVLEIILLVFFLINLLMVSVTFARDL